MQVINDDSIIKRNTDILFNKLDDEFVMMSISKGQYYGLDNIASRIYELIEPPITLKKLIVKLLEEYEVDKEKCKKDVSNFVLQLAEKEIVVIE
jgi:hypothetical protein